MKHDAVIATPALSRGKQSRFTNGLLRRAFALLAMTMVFISIESHAATIDYSSFKKIPVLHEGRVKPLDSYARVKLREFSGSEHDAVAWLALSLLDPGFAASLPLFPVSSRGIEILLGLDPDKKLFSFNELQASLRDEQITIDRLLLLKPENLTPEQKELLQLQDHVVGYGNVLRSFSVILPLDIEMPKKYAIEHPTYIGFSDKQEALMSELQKLIKRKGDNPEKYNEEEKKLASLGYGLQKILNGGAGNDEFKVIPGRTKYERTSPWETVLLGDNPAKLDEWEKLANAYRQLDFTLFNQIAKEISVHTKDYSPFKFRLEIFYNSIKPFHVALLLYGLSLAFAVIAASGPIAVFEKLSLGCIGTGLAAHAFGIIARMIILSRPPVGTLYEAILFVSFICAAIGFILYIRQQNGPAIFAGLISAIALLTIAPALLSSGESMEMLVAVLNTSFWLSTHVLCITGGYALSIVTGCLAHFFLFETARGNNAVALRRSLYAFSLAALLLTAVGTALGGIWADQSWGRFWGWDPKENGALLIVLWLAWLQHGRIGDTLSPLAFAAGTAFLNVIVALAWFGVNLLNVGLHSYGFTSGIAAGLLTFCTAETILIAALWIYAFRKENNAH
jgi:ABC-type transport system involved in cytochrome c biogenesis permease subunit